MGSPFNESLRFELIHQSTGICFVDRYDFGKATLIDFGMVFDDCQNRPLRHLHIFVLEFFRNDGG